MLIFTAVGPNTQHWLMFDRVVQQIVLQMDERRSSDVDPDNEKQSITKPQDPDVAIIKIDVKKIVQLLVKEEELVAARIKADEMEKENADIQSKLAKKEQDLDLRMQEKEDLETSLARMRERLEKESGNHTQAVQRAQNAEMKVEDLQHRFAQEQHERIRLERLVNEGSIPDDQKVAGLHHGCNGKISPQSSISKTTVTTGLTSTTAAPPPPPPFLMPPPPPPVPGSGIPAPPMSMNQGIIHKYSFYTFLQFFLIKYLKLKFLC